MVARFHMPWGLRARAGLVWGTGSGVRWTSGQVPPASVWAPLGSLLTPPEPRLTRERRMVAEPSPAGAERSCEAPAGPRQAAAFVISATRISVSTAHQVPWSLGLRSLSRVPSHSEPRRLGTAAHPFLLIDCDVGGLGSALLGGRLLPLQGWEPDAWPPGGAHNWDASPGFSMRPGLPNSPGAPSSKPEGAMRGPIPWPVTAQSVTLCCWRQAQTPAQSPLPVQSVR